MKGWINQNNSEKMLITQFTKSGYFYLIETRKTFYMNDHTLSTTKNKHTQKKPLSSVA